MKLNGLRTPKYTKANKKKSQAQAIIVKIDLLKAEIKKTMDDENELRKKSGIESLSLDELVRAKKQIEIDTLQNQYEKLMSRKFGFNRYFK
jgi:hypothetical protein